VIDLATYIEGAGPRLTQRVLDGMYEDPFWAARYGARGRKHADEDSAYHVMYLVEALRSDNPDVMTRYAHWLRSVLVPRGMCSAHLDENFERLAHALREEPPDVSPALAVLEQARNALRYEHGAGAWLEARTGELKRQVWARLLERYPHEPEYAHARVESLLSYLADALQLDRPELFVQHVAFLGGMHRARGSSSAQLSCTLSALRESLAADQEGPDASFAASARSTLSAAEAALVPPSTLLQEAP
jgi:hypothetical protein